MAKETYPKAYLYRRVVQAKLFMDSHYLEKINLDEIADEAAFSRYHFIRLFRLAYQKTPHQYLTSLRIDEAERLMQKENNNIQDICFAVGFESIGTFTTLFKRVTGFSPKVRQKMILEKLRASRESPLTMVPGCFVQKMGS